MGKHDPIDFCGEIKHETDMAYLVFDGENDIWIPKSQCQSVHPIKGADYEFVIPEWLAIEKGII